MTVDLLPAVDDPFVGLDQRAVADLGPLAKGKVRDVVDLGETVALVATDRISAFDHGLGTVPYRGQVLTQMAAWWFERIGDIVNSHVLAVPDPNITIGRKCAALPVEVVVRSRLTGSTATSLWTRYAAGERTIYGIVFPAGMKKNDPLPTPIITPTTKADSGAHDAPITELEIVGRGLVAAELWEEVRVAALAVFDRGSQLAASAGLVLVDTKYEFGVDAHGTLTIIDEVHTPDSSRLWQASTVDQRIDAGLEPDNLDKEFLRLAYRAAGYPGHGEPPPLSQSLATATAELYVRVFEQVTGTEFLPAEYPAPPRIAVALHEWAAARG